MKKDISYRADFVRGFGNLFAAESARAHYEGSGVSSMDLSGDGNFVTVHYIGGGEKVVNVSGDSLCAIAYDVIRYAL